MADLTADELIELAEAPAEMQTDGQVVKERSAADVLALNNAAISKTALADTNSNGGPRSGWSCLRTARAVPGDG